MKKRFVHNLKSTYEAIMDLEIPSFLIVQDDDSSNEGRMPSPDWPWAERQGRLP